MSSVGTYEDSALLGFVEECVECPHCGELNVVIPEDIKIFECLDCGGSYITKMVNLKTITYGL